VVRSAHATILNNTEPGQPLPACFVKILVIDIGGIGIKLAMNDKPATTVPTPPDMTPAQLLQLTGSATRGWHYDRVSIGYPGPVRHNRPVREPVNLGRGWVEFDFEAAFGRPVRMVNDAALQALGSYHGGVMLFLGLGTGLGTTLVHDGHVVPMEIAHLPFRDGETFETALGMAGLDRVGETLWKARVREAIELFNYTLYPDYLVLGGGNSRRFAPGELPDYVEYGDNSHAFSGGLRLWEDQPNLPAP
jgi:polyphosphate glucokinase